MDSTFTMQQDQIPPDDLDTRVGSSPEDLSPLPNSQSDLSAIAKDALSIPKILSVDTAGDVTYSLIVGALLDYSVGLSPMGIVASRASGTLFNMFSGGPYGWWREKICQFTRTTEKSVRMRKSLAELLAFNTFQVPAYTLVVAAASLFSEGEVDLEKASTAAQHLALFSPLVGPTMGLYLDGFRRIFGVRSAAEGNYGKK